MSTIPRKARVAAMAVAVASMLCLSACTGAPTAQPTAQEFTGVVPAADGTLDDATWNLPNGEPGSIDPILAYDPSSSTVTSNMCESLLTYDDDNQLSPGLASAWDQTDPSTLVLTIRPDVTFWDGAALTPQDVVDSLLRNVDPASGSYWSVPWFSNVASIAATGTDQVTISFTQPDAAFIDMLTTNAGQVSEAAYVKSAGAAYGTPQGGLMCTGPFEFASWTPGESITMTANDTYWNPDHAAKTASVTFSFVTDASTLTNALTTGEIDGSYDLPVSAAATLGTSGAGTVYAGAHDKLVYLISSTKQGPMADIDVRSAVNLAIDRKAIASAIFKGAAVPAWSLAGVESAPESVSSVNDELPGSAVDLEKAKSLVEGAQVDTSTPITIAVPSEDAASGQTATYLQSSLQQIGLTLEIKEMPFAQFAGSLLGGPEASSAYDLYLFNGYVDVPEVLPSLLTTMLPGATFNIGGLDDSELNETLEQARGVEDEDERDTLVRQALVRNSEVGQFIIPVVSPRPLMFMHEGVTGAPADLLKSLYSPWAASLGSAG